MTRKINALHPQDIQNAEWSLNSQFTSVSSVKQIYLIRPTLYTSLISSVPLEAGHTLLWS